MTALGKSIGALLIARTNLLVTMAAATVHNGAAFDLFSLPAKANGLCAVLAMKANLDSADTAVLDQIKVESASAANFSDAATVGTGATVTLTGANGVTDVDYLGQVKVDVDLTRLPVNHRYVRISARSTLSDTANTSGQVAGVLLFGGLATAPHA